jgi:hypothetical protein
MPAMKKILLSLSMLLGMNALYAQTTVTNSIFLNGGDTLVRSVTVNSGSLTITPPASNAQSWDMSFLTTDATLYDSVRYASAGMAFSDFPNTEIILPVLGFGQGYVDVDTSAMTMIGAGLELFGMAFVAPFSNPQILQTAPLTYGTTNNDTHALLFAQHIDSVPGLRQLIDQMGLPVSPDSIRLNVDGTTDMTVDAYGTLTMFDSTYNVLRQKVEIINETKIEVFVPAFGSGFWLDVTSTVSGMLPFPLNDTTFRYDFLTEGSKIPVVRVNMLGNGSTIRDIEFKGYNENTAVFNTPLREITVFPVPANDFIQVNSSEINEAYNLQIVDAMGRVILKKQNISDRQLQLNISELPQGNFWLMLTNEKGKMIAGKQITIVR